MTGHAASMPRTLAPGRSAIGMGAGVTVLVALASAAGHVRTPEVLGLGLCLAGVWSLRHLPRERVVAVLFGASVLAAITALLLPAHRGTHRWIVLGSVHLHAALALCVAATLHVACVRSLRAKVACASTAIGLLVLSASFTLAVATLCAALLPLGRTLLRPRSLAAIAVVVAGLALAVFTNPNRVERLSEFASGSTAHNYQLQQARFAIGETQWLGASAAKGWVLPCASNDYAFADLLRSMGLAAGCVWILAQMLLVVTLVAAATRARGAHRTMLRHAAALLGVLAVGHVLVNLTWLPPTGVPAAFTGTGGSIYALVGFATLFPLIGATSRDVTPRRTRARLVAVPAGALALVALAVLTCRWHENPLAGTSAYASSVPVATTPGVAEHGAPTARKRTALVLLRASDDAARTSDQLLRALAAADPAGHAHVLVRTLAPQATDDEYRAVGRTSAGHGVRPARKRDPQVEALMAMVMGTRPYTVVVLDDGTRPAVRYRNTGLAETDVHELADALGATPTDAPASAFADYVCDVQGAALVQLTAPRTEAGTRHVAAYLCAISGSTERREAP